MQAIFLLRHGQAEADEGVGGDPQRKLTSAGMAEIGRQAGHLFGLGEGLAHIYHSPYLRARETAIIVARTFPGAKRHNLPALVPGGEDEQVIAAIAGTLGGLLLVSHLPLIARVAHSLCEEAISFRPGTLAKIERADAHHFSGRLRWVRHPEP